MSSLRADTPDEAELWLSELCLKIGLVRGRPAVRTDQSGAGAATGASPERGHIERDAFGGRYRLWFSCEQGSVNVTADHPVEYTAIANRRMSYRINLDDPVCILGL